MKNLLKDKTMTLALSILQLGKLLQEKREYIISKQLIKSGTSVGANVREAQYAESKKDFVHKLKISLKELNETQYWLEFLQKADNIKYTEFELINAKCTELNKILSSSVLTTTKRYLNTSHS